MDIRAATAAYEAWLGERITLLPADLAAKHAAMQGAVFPFFRGTFYRFMQLWPEVCAECCQAPETLSVGDLHVENFGTWRDIEGRLTWGINDFDEAFPLPYTLDLVRLATSARLAIEEAHLALDHKDACEEILAGYQASLACGGGTFVLAENQLWLREMMTGELRDPVHFWNKLEALPTLTTPLAPKVERALRRLLPDPDLPIRVAHRVAGIGSLGRERFVAIAEFRGGRIAREAKALAPSACVWADPAVDVEANQKSRYQEIMDRAVRSLDPFVARRGKWIVRRLGPDCSRVELGSIPRRRDERQLLRAMGFEVANIHLGTPKCVTKITADLKERESGWLHHAAKRMAAATARDWEVWRGPQSP